MKMPMMVLTAASLLTAGCAHVEIGASVGSGKDQIVAADASPLNSSAAISLKGIRPYENKLIEADVLNNQGQWGDIASLEIWPIAGVGIGWCGLGFHVLQLEAHAGIFGYKPHFPVPAPKTQPVTPPPAVAPVPEKATQTK